MTEDTVKDPIVELLAIKLYEHDHDGKWPVRPDRGAASWMATDPEDRELYRRIARGEEPLPTTS